MSGFTEFSSSNRSSSSIPSFVFGSSSSSSSSTSSSTPFGSFGPASPSFSTSNFGFSSSTSTPYFGSSSSSTSCSTTINQNNDEARDKKIIEALELLEQKSENGLFPQRKLQEIKQEVEKKYPNIFTTQTNNQESNDDNDLVAQEQEMNRYIQSHMSQIHKMERQLKVFGETTSPGLSSNYGVNHSSNYHYGDEVNHFFGNQGLGSDGYSALSFLGSLLGGINF